MKTTNVCLVAICVLEIIFVAVCFVFYANGLTVNSTLISYWHITFVSELFACAGIKVSKIIHRTDDVEEDDEGAVG